MKLAKDIYNELRDAIATIVKEDGMAERIAKCEASQLSVMWQLYHIVIFDWRNEDPHPTFTVRKRRFAFRGYPYWSIYSDGINDTHIATALKSIAKELGIKQT